MFIIITLVIYQKSPSLYLHSTLVPLILKINDVDRKTLNVGDVVNLTAEITGTGYYNKQIAWSIEGGNTTISKNGTFMVHKNDSGKTLKVTAKVDDKTDTLNFTVN